ncbi:nucleotidyltransferase family protein [bacterium]|nr:nucleotidyltransferase family protein [bacterium]
MKNAGPVQGVILAAGRSRRTAPEYKPMLAWAETTIIGQVCNTLKTCCSSIIIVVGYQKEIIIDFFRNEPDLITVTNDRFDLSMFLSVKTGVTAVRAPRFFLVPADYPLVRSETLQHLLDQADPIVIPTYQGRKGHPVLIDSNLIPALLAEPDHSTLRAFIARTGFSPLEVDDPGILSDIDDLESYVRLKP